MGVHEWSVWNSAKSTFGGYSSVHVNFHTEKYCWDRENSAIYCYQRPSPTELAPVFVNTIRKTTYVCIQEHSADINWHSSNRSNRIQ